MWVFEPVRGILSNATKKNRKRNESMTNPQRTTIPSNHGWKAIGATSAVCRGMLLISQDQHRRGWFLTCLPKERKDGPEARNGAFFPASTRATCSRHINIQDHGSRLRGTMTLLMAFPLFQDTTRKASFCQVFLLRW
jgi:hypothetical protein